MKPSATFETKKTFCFFALILLLLAANAFSTVTLITEGAYLKDLSGALMATNALVLLVASTEDTTFSVPAPNAFVTGDDIIVGRWDLSGTGEPGILLDFTNTALSGNWNEGDPLQLYWFPTLTVATVSPGAGTPYGQYRTDSMIDGGDPWTTPADGATISLKFLTSNAGGSNPEVAGNASLVVEGGLAPPVILSLTIANETNTVIVWSAVSNHTYRVQYQSELDAAWSDLAPDITATNVAASIVDGFTGQAQRFYRIQLVQ